MYHRLSHEQKKKTCASLGLLRAHTRGNNIAGDKICGRFIMYCRVNLYRAQLLSVKTLKITKNNYYVQSINVDTSRALCE